jgi:hypothetical protein
MILLLCITFGFGIACIGGIAYGLMFLVKACNQLPENAKTARNLGLSCVIGSTAFGLFWAWQILTTSKQLVFEDGGPGPFGLLAFPLWAVVAVTPAFIGGLVFGWIASRLKKGRR